MHLPRYFALALLATTACATAGLTPAGAKVLTSQSAPIDHGYAPGTCTSLGYIVGRGGGSFGGGWIPNDSLIEYAMNDLRNKAAAKGANYIQHDSPQLGVSGDGNGGSSTSTATISGTAYKCPTPAAAASVAATRVPGASPQAPAASPPQGAADGGALSL